MTLARSNKLIDYLSGYAACKQGIETLAEYSTPQEAWDNVEPEYLIWATIETNLVSDEDKKRFARWCALSVAGLWDMPEVVRRYLESGDEELRDEAMEATWETAKKAVRELGWKTAWLAPWKAAWAAAWRSSWAAVRDIVREAALTAARAEAWNASRETPWTVSEAREAARASQAMWIRANIKPDWSVIG